MLELIRGKRLVFAGDSINRNQWESLLCLLMGAVKDPTKVYETRGRRITKTRGVYSYRFVVRIYAPRFISVCQKHISFPCLNLCVFLLHNVFAYCCGGFAM